MNHEVTKAICRDSKSYKKQVLKPASAPTEKETYWNSKNRKKYIIRSKIFAYLADDGLHENTT
jgi:hypothetical protein